ncbi:HIV Tat-specific factor 1 [Adelges cooleyi]|uniref:HIV Tat-specific factor 1 n=1 Tax=Adelges cooleyi TaxID=133065 RepID=UPI00217F6AB5|nr:HIV Tat-specific factor 1 [Adelges cooleyi]XP_050431750.1 HIV Tat-specific factor 1 [Adelges cooleyi]
METTSTSEEPKSIERTDSSNYKYVDNVCIYTEPNSKKEYTWDKEKNTWIENGFENYEFDDIHKTYTYTDKQTNTTYLWNLKDNKWEVKNKETISLVEEKADENVDEEFDDDEEDDDDGFDGRKEKKRRTVKRQDMSKGKYGHDGNTQTYTDPADGTVYIWDKEKNAWFPKIDDDFLAHYQLSYGFGSSNVNTVEQKNYSQTNSLECPNIGNQAKLNSNDKVKTVEEDKTEAVKQKLPQSTEPNWFEVDEEHNTKVYVSNLPLDISEQEFIDLMQKCGLVMKDLDTGRMKVKLYTERGTDILKGDALCTYIKRESVDLALKLLDGYKLRDKEIHVELAKFTMRGEKYNPALKPKKKKRKDKEKMKKIQEKLFDWRPDKMRGERGKNESIVIVKNLFEKETFDNDVALLLEYQKDLREECSKCGVVKKVIVYDRHPDGVAQINFKEPDAADACVQLLNNRWFGQRQITAEIWDGKTKYKVIETPDETEERLKKWETYLLSTGNTETNDAHESDDDSVKTKSDGESDDEVQPVSV